MARRRGAAAALAALAPAAALAGSPPAAGRPHAGAADLSGVWSTATVTPFQRPAEFAGPTVPAAEVAAYERQANDPGYMASLANKDPASRGEVTIGGFETEWTEPAHLDVIDGAARSSVVTTPANGRIPYAPGAQARFPLSGFANKNFDDPETRPLQERCVTGKGAVGGPPLASTVYNSRIQIVQTPRTVAIVVEMNHDVRLISLDPDARPSAPGSRDMGDSVGRWEGRTLVVETTNFPAPFHGRTLLSPAARVVERFTRAGPDRLSYTFTVDDPVNYTRPWGGERMLRAADAPLREYACHEGNYSLPAILAGARRAEAEAPTTSAPR